MKPAGRTGVSSLQNDIKCIDISEPSAVASLSESEPNGVDLLGWKKRVCRVRTSFNGKAKRMRHFKIWRLGLFLLALLCSFHLRADVPSPTTNNVYTWLDSWSFYDTNAWTSDFGFAPLSYTNISGTSLKSGMPAMLIDDPANAAWLQYNVWESDGTNNLALNQGSVTFWFAPLWTSQNQGGSGPTTNPAQSLTISNYSFEFPSTANNTDGIPGWTIAGSADAGVLNSVFYAGVVAATPGGIQAGFINGWGTYTTVSQVLEDNLQPDMTYTLSIALTGRFDGYNPGTNYSVSLYAGTNLLASVMPLAPPVGVWTNLQAAYTSGDYVPSGESLQIVIATSETELDFDDVQLIASSAPPAPPVQQITISNYSFEYPSTTTYTEPLAGWSITGSTDDGVLNSQYFSGTVAAAPDGIQAGFINGWGTYTTVSQVLSNNLQPDMTYTLSIAVTGRLDGYNPGTNYSVSLYAGTNLLVSEPSVAPPVGVWTNLQATYTSGDIVPSGESLEIVLATSETELDFDNVQLTAQSLQPVNNRLFEVGAYTPNADYGWWSLYLDNLGNNLYFSAQDSNGNLANYLSAPISFLSNTWHSVALTWSSTNTALYVDGALATNGAGISVLPSAQVQSNGFWIGSDSVGSQQAQGMFGAVTTYNYPLDTNYVYAIYTLSSIFYGVTANIGQAPAEPETSPTFEAVTGPGYLTLVSSNSGCGNISNVWITNLTATVSNGTENLTFTIAGGSNGLPYDVFATPALTQPLTNGTWTWMGQGYQCCTYTIPALTNSAVFLILGTPKDSDSDGLTDAYELLVSHTDPNNPDTSGDGMLDGWKVLWGLNPPANNPAQPSERFNYSYDGTGRLQTNSGVSIIGLSPELFGFDAEGNISSDQP
jgi:Concanavalin A-like lectin/glucanases superfamily